MAATTLLLERTVSETIWPDWEAPAGGSATLPRIGRISFTYRGCDDDHLHGQSCLALDPTDADSEICLVAFACGCRVRVLRRLLEAH